MAVLGRWRRSAGGAPDDGRRVELVLPVGSMVNAADLHSWLADWCGAARGAVPLLPAGLAWAGPRPGDPERGEPDGGWVWQMSWSPAARDPGAKPSGSLASDGAIPAALEVAAWLYDRTRSGDDPPIGGPRAYAVAAVSGLARRTGGAVRLPGGRPGAPGDPPATWSVYLSSRVAAQDAVGCLGELVPGLSLASAAGRSSWVLEEPEGRGLWLDELDVDGADSWELFPGPQEVAVCALQRLRSAHLWVVRCEGANDQADAADRAWLGMVASHLGSTLGGLAVDAEGFPVLSAA